MLKDLLIEPQKTGETTFKLLRSVGGSAAARFERAWRSIKSGNVQMAYVTLPSIDFFDNSHFNYAQAEILGYLRHFHPEFDHPEARIFHSIDPTAYLKAGAGNFNVEELVGDLFGKLEEIKPNVIAISAKLGTNDLLALLVAKLNAAEWCANSVIIVGGTLPTFSHRLIGDELPGVIFSAGEGEHVLTAVYTQLKSEYPKFSEIPNIAYFTEDGKEVAHPKTVLSLEDIHWLPALDALAHAVENSKIIVAGLRSGARPTVRFARSASSTKRVSQTEKVRRAWVGATIR